MSPFDLTRLLFGDLISLFLYINAAIIIIVIVFVKPRKVTSIYLWIAAFLLLPMIFVLIFYIFFGRDYHRQKLFKNKWVKDANVVKLLREQRKNLVLTSESYVNIPAREHRARAHADQHQQQLRHHGQRGALHQRRRRVLQGLVRGDLQGEALRPYGDVHHPQ